MHSAIEDRNSKGGDCFFDVGAIAAKVDSVDIAEAAVANVVKHCQVLSILGRSNLAESPLLTNSQIFRDTWSKPPGIHHFSSLGLIRPSGWLSR